MTLDLSKYVGCRYGKPYDCFTLIKSVRKILGLPTPTYGDLDLGNQVYELNRHMQLPTYQPRKSVYVGEIGDILLMSQSVEIPPHHCAVFVTDTELLHAEFRGGVSLLPLHQVWDRYPGSVSRWFYAG